MGFRFRKSFKIAPGVRVNVGKKGSSLSVGGKGVTTTYSKKGSRTTYSIPGTGMSYSSRGKGCLVAFGLIAALSFATVGAMAALIL